MFFDFICVIGVILCKVIVVDYEGCFVELIVVSCVYDIECDDFWDVFMNLDCFFCWFVFIEGDFCFGGCYQLKGNVGGEIFECELLLCFVVMWEMGGGISWVCVDFEVQIEGGILLMFEYFVYMLLEFWKQYGLGVIGVGWDFMFFGFVEFFGDVLVVVFEMVEEWVLLEDGKSFSWVSSEVWGEVLFVMGIDFEVVCLVIDNMIKFYIGEG